MDDLLARETDLYDALVARDPAFEGRAYVGVTTTGIFCRLTCPARKPHREHCRFYRTAGACLEAGFRSCKRCRPLGLTDNEEPAVAALTAALEADPGRRWTEADIEAAGFDPSTVRRVFKRRFGITFLAMARLARLRQGAQTLAEGGPVIQAQLDAGFASASGFRAAMAGLLGVTPAALTSGRALLHAHWIDTPLGPMVAVADTSRLHLLEFAGRRALARELRKLAEIAGGAPAIGRTAPIEQLAGELSAYFAAEAATFATPLALHGTPFTRRVWAELMKIPAGETRSYADIAVAIGQPTATRAVARANGANQLALVVPCHRVIGADGSLTGYGGGLWRKRALIDLESRLAAGRGA